MDLGEPPFHPKLRCNHLMLKLAPNQISSGQEDIGGENQNKKIGEDLEIEILLRLPLKSLMRFKCVQRSWKNFIKTPYFVNRKINLSYIPAPNRSSSFLIIENSTLKLLPCDCDHEKPMLLVNSLFPNHLTRIKSYGSCNGVFCLEGKYTNTSTRAQCTRLILWNPTTNEVHRIPRVHSGGGTTFSYGLGTVGGDFKIVRLAISINGWRKLLCPSSQVYSLNTKSWTVIDNSCPSIMVIDGSSHLRYNPSRYNPSRYNALVNGVYHWIVNAEEDILCFNFSNNQFQQLKAPISYQRRDTYRDDVLEIKGSLGYVMLSNKFDKVCVEIWVMDQNKWSKKYHMKFNMSMHNLHRFGNDAAEIFEGKAGELLKSYDHHENKLRQFQIEVPENDCYFSIYEYVPSITLLSK